MLTVEDILMIVISGVAGLGGGAVLIWAMSSWLSKVWANRLLEKDRLRYSRELEAVKSELGRASQEYLIKFSDLHSKRGALISELYKKLVAAHHQMNSTLKLFQHAGEPALEDKVKKFVDLLNDFFRFYFDNRIYFPSTVCQQIEELGIALKNAFITITVYPVDFRSEEFKYQPELLKGRHELWKEARELFNTKAEPLFTTIELHFRKLLGVE